MHTGHVTLEDNEGSRTPHDSSVRIYNPFIPRAVLIMCSEQGQIFMGRPICQLPDCKDTTLRVDLSREEMQIYK